MTRNAWGGARAGAGRRASGPIASEAHKTRRSFNHAQVRIVARVIDGLGSLRKGAARSAIAGALERAAERHDFAVLSVVIRSKRLELVVAADHHVALARGMQGLQVSAAKRLNNAVGRSGPVFPDRYRIVAVGGARATKPAPVTKGMSSPVLISPRLAVASKDELRTLKETAWIAVTNPRRSWWL